MKHPRARRRSQVEVRQAILAAATRLFAERGYANTTTRAIATEAHASEVLLYKYYSSKADLFERAISLRFDEMMNDARNMIQTRPKGERIEYSRDFISELYRMFLADKGLMLALITARAYNDAPEDYAEKSIGLRRFFEGAEERVARSWDEVGFKSDISASLASRLAFASVLAGALLGDWLFEDRQSDAEITNAISQFVVRGLYGVPFGGPAKTSAD
ncbi:MAG TPA: helix-turn-helix domain-containing protein [Novosphingobium sp.]|nr:helix-turn-helix domain-containing protein [Novosphingobium sp.]